MIGFSDFINHRWSYISRNLISNFGSLTGQLKLTLDNTQKNAANAQTNAAKFKNTEMIKFISKWIENLTVAESESSIIHTFSQYLIVLDAERGKMKLHIKYIYRENQWLRHEMFDLHRNLMIIERDFLIAEAEKKYYQYCYNMRNYSTECRRSSVQMLKNTVLQDDDDSEPDDDVPTQLNPLFHVVLQFIAESRHTVAISWCQKSISDYQKQNGEMSAEVGAIYNLLGRVYKDFGFYSIAQECFEKALVIRERVHGKQSDQVGVTLSHLGSILGKRELFKEAVSACKHALSIREITKLKNPMDVARLCAKIADFSMELKIWNDAIEYYKVALNVFDSVYDSTEMLMIKSNTNLARAYLETNQLVKSADCIQFVNSAYMRKNNPGSSKTETPFSVIKDSCDKKELDFKVEMLVEKFGKISEVSDERIIDVMIGYFQKQDQSNIVNVLKGWTEISNRNIDKAAIDDSKLFRKISETSTNLGRKDSTQSHGSSVRQSLRNMFKGKK